MPQVDPLTAAQRASFATSARLFSCLVTESLVRALYVPLKASEAVVSVTGVCVVFNGSGTDSESELLAVIPLRHIPVFKRGAAVDARGREIGLLDPMDMMPLVYHVHEKSIANGHAVPEDKVRPHYRSGYRLPTAHRLMLRHLHLHIILPSARKPHSSHNRRALLPSLVHDSPLFTRSPPFQRPHPPVAQVRRRYQARTEAHEGYSRRAGERCDMADVFI